MVEARGADRGEGERPVLVERDRGNAAPAEHRGPPLLSDDGKTHGAVVEIEHAVEILDGERDGAHLGGIGQQVLRMGCGGFGGHGRPFGFISQNA